jgi:putative SOS response-associated peptidase YedK
MIMCGRFGFARKVDAVRASFGFDNDPGVAFKPVFAPTDPVPAIRRRADGSRALHGLRWGLVPSWAKGLEVGVKMFNARAETLAEKPSFRDALGRRRCLILADGFFEWQKREGPEGESRGKQVWRMERPDGAAFAFAGLWERWQGADGIRTDTCTIITTAANETLRPIHDRMPVVVEAGDYEAWLDKETPAQLVRNIIRQPGIDFFKAAPIAPDFDRESGARQMALIAPL